MAVKKKAKKKTQRADRAPVVRKKATVKRRKSESTIVATAARKNRERKQKAAPPLHDPDGFDWDLLELCCFYQCTGEEAAALMRVSYDTVARKIKAAYGMTFAEYYAEKSAGGRASLRRAQYRNAIHENNVAMQIWLGKQTLGQSEKGELNLNTSSRDGVAAAIRALVGKGGK